MNSREKGARGERDLAKVLRMYGYEARRGQQYCGANGDADVVSSIPNVHIECKRVERGSGSIHEWMKQAQRDATPEEMPAVFHRKNREEWLVTIRLEDFINLIEKR